MSTVYFKLSIHYICSVEISFNLSIFKYNTQFYVFLTCCCHQSASSLLCMDFFTTKIQLNIVYGYLTAKIKLKIVYNFYYRNLTKYCVLKIFDCKTLTKYCSWISDFKIKPKKFNVVEKENKVALTCPVWGSLPMTVVHQRTVSIGSLTGRVLTATHFLIRRQIPVSC